METFSKRLGPWLMLCRVSNLPTCFSNVLLGWSLAGPTSDRSLWVSCLVLWAATAYYLAGMALNDLVDAKADALVRGFRPIPSGKITSRQASRMILGLFVTATLATFMIGPVTGLMGLGLVISILIYDFYHKQMGWTILLMGTCRGFLVLLGASAALEASSDAYTQEAMMRTRMYLVHPMLLISSGTLTVYTLLVTWVARFEDKGLASANFKIRFISMLPGAVVLIAIGLALAVVEPRAYDAVNVYALLAICFFLGWQFYICGLVWRKPPKLIHAIMAWLAGMCLIDLVWLSATKGTSLTGFRGASPTGFGGAILATILCFALTVKAQRKILGS